MNEQSEALRLADYIQSRTRPIDSGTALMAAAELRRLHSLNAELLEALRNLAKLYDTDEGCRSLPEYIAARAAIAKVGIT